MSYVNKHNRESVRLKGYDYGSDGAYFITICSYKSQLLFGEIRNEKMFPNEIGELIYKEWHTTPELRKYITLGEFQVMPNHLHGIIFIHKSSEYPLPLPSVSIFSRLIVSDFENKFGSQTHNLSSVIRGLKSAFTTSMRKTGSAEKIWQSKYHEHIIRNQEKLERIENYIRGNAAKWVNDCYFQ